MVYQWTVIPAQILSAYRLYILITYLFIHGSPGHLIFNMWFLWIFGDNIEKSLGRLKYLVLYLTFGIVSALLFSVAAPTKDLPLIGASGAIAGLIGAYLILFPRNPMVIFFPPVFIFKLAAKWVIVYWLFLQFIYSFAFGNNMVAYSAHIFGLLTGLFAGGLVLWSRKKRPTNTFCLLLFTDSLARQKNYEQIFWDRGWQVTTSTNLTEGLALLKRLKFDGIIFDMDLNTKQTTLVSLFNIFHTYPHLAQIPVFVAGPGFWDFLRKANIFTRLNNLVDFKNNFLLLEQKIEAGLIADRLN
jgi:membrane associated rhomboid family serine protease